MQFPIALDSREARMKVNPRMRALLGEFIAQCPHILSFAPLPTSQKVNRVGGGGMWRSKCLDQVVE